eukprot:gene3092-3868_t
MTKSLEISNYDDILGELDMAVNRTSVFYKKQILMASGTRLSMSDIKSAPPYEIKQILEQLQTLNVVLTCQEDIEFFNYIKDSTKLKHLLIGIESSSVITIPAGLIPISVDTLKLHVSFNPNYYFPPNPFQMTLEHGTIPSSVKKLTTDHLLFKHDITLIPSSVEDLQIYNWRFNFEDQLENILPLDIKTLNISLQEGQSFGVLPKELKNLIMVVPEGHHMAPGSLPSTLKSFDTHYYGLPFELGSLPSSLESLKIENYRDGLILEKGILHEGLKSLTLRPSRIEDGVWDTPVLVGNILPRSLETLQLSPYIPISFSFDSSFSALKCLEINFVEILKDKLPPNLERLTLIDEITTIESGALPQSIKYLKFSSVVSVPINSEMMPQSIEHLIFFQGIKASPFPFPPIPPTCTRLEYYYLQGTSDPVPAGWIPSTCTDVVFSTHFYTQNLDLHFTDSILPEGIKKFDLSQWYNQSIEPYKIHIPSTVESLQLYGFGENPELFMKFPMALIKIFGESKSRMEIEVNKNDLYVTPSSEPKKTDKNENIADNPPSSSEKDVVNNYYPNPPSTPFTPEPTPSPTPSPTIPPTPSPTLPPPTPSPTLPPTQSPTQTPTQSYFNPYQTSPTPNVVLTQTPYNPYGQLSPPPTQPSYTQSPTQPPTSPPPTPRPTTEIEKLRVNASLGIPNPYFSSYQVKPLPTFINFKSTDQSKEKQLYFVYNYNIDSNDIYSNNSQQQMYKIKYQPLVFQNSNISSTIYPPRYENYTNPSELEELILYNELYSYPNGSSMDYYFSELEDYQFPMSKIPCEKIPSMTAVLKSWGFGSAMHFIVYELHLTLYHKRMLTLQMGSYKYGVFQKTFIGISRCDFYEYSKAGKYPVPMRGYGIFPDTNEMIWSFGDDDQDNYGLDVVKNKYNTMKASQFQLDILNSVSMYIDFAMRPTSTLRDYVSEARQYLYNSTKPFSKCVSMHVRHGDKFQESTMMPFSYYHDALSIMNLTDIHHVFLLTDDPLVAESAKINGKSANITYVYLPWERVENIGKAHDKFSAVDKEIYAYQIFAELDIASDCEYFIGSLSSNIDRLILELSQTKYRPDGTIFKYVNINSGTYTDLR